jgi:hypothetical protein
LLLRSRFEARLQIDADPLFRLHSRLFCGHRSPVSGHVLRTRYAVLFDGSFSLRTHAAKMAHLDQGGLAPALLWYFSLVLNPA